ncbi:hypothetical protein DM794_20825 [Paenarthrobacter ureafaciens]|uniref:alpha-amylase family protein n=1 Tax=Paenarthrobacter ureafaciens TaxID=37931 RepID=UPI0015BB5D97|nr:alpha-amylase family protein [Paenarthrobacter ureafaciens]NWL29472.1 hypothetical protein [Paenarthrobacter ureafaciens]BCW82621.1 hypothetical protein NicSoilE8_02940 [Arthrobacter sp. NicSoilE8]
MEQTLTAYERDLPPDSRWRKPFNVLQTNLQEIDASMDVEAAAQAAVDFGADTWLLNAGGIMSFYPTDLPFQTRNPLLRLRASGDLFGDALVAAKARGLKVIARFDMSKITARLAREHPEWLFQSAEGKPQIYNTLYSVCPSGDYYQSRTFEVLDEVLDRYDVDAVFFNWFNFNVRDYDEVVHGPCHCEACRKGFALFSGGAELPVDMTSPSFGLWRQYTETTLKALTARIADHVAARERDIGVLLREGAPMVYIEGSNAFKSMPGKELWPHATAEAVSAHVASRPGASLMVNCVGFIDSAYRMGAEQPEHFAQYVVQTMARGGNPSAYYFGAPGRLPTEWTISQARDAMAFRQRNAAVYEGLRPAAEIALVRPGFSSANGRNYWDLTEEFRGLYLSLLEAGLPFDVLPVNALPGVEADQTLSRYKLIVLPEMSNLGPAAAAIDGFVDRGGNLICTGSAGVGRDGDIELDSALALQALSPAAEGHDLRSTYISDKPQPAMAEYGYGPGILPVYGRYQRYVWKPGAQASGFILPQAPFGPPELAYGHQGSSDPAYVCGSYGAGQVLHIPWTIGRTYREFGKTDVRDHFVERVKLMVRPELTAQVHESIEVIAGANTQGRVVHLINHSGVRRRSYGPHLPYSGGTLRLGGAAATPSAVRALVAGTALETRTDGPDLVVDLPTIELFEVVQFSNAQHPPAL